MLILKHYYIYPDSQVCRFWTEHATNLWWQKGNKFHTEFVIWILYNIDKLSSEIWQNLLTYVSKLVTDMQICWWH